MEEEKIKYIRGVKGRGEEVRKLLERLGVTNHGEDAAYYENPENLYYIEGDEALWQKRDSNLGCMIIAHGEEMFLPVKFKYKVGDRVVVRYDNSLNGKVVTITDCQVFKGEPCYNFKGDTDRGWRFYEAYLEPYEEPQVKTLDDLMGKEIEGYYIDGDTSEIWSTLNPECRETEKNRAATEKVAKAMLAMAQISQLLPHYGGPITDEEWLDSDLLKYTVGRVRGEIETSDIRVYYCPLAFHTAEQRDEFLANNERLVKDYLQLD